MKVDRVIDVSRGDKFLSHYLKEDPTIKKVLIAFFHGIGDLVMFLKVFEKLKATYPEHHFDLGLCKGLGEEEIYSKAVLLEPDWREKADTLGYDLVFSCNMPMNETQIVYTKGEWSCIKELGIDPVWGHLPPDKASKGLVGCHFQITCLPDAANVPYDVAKKVWLEIKDAGYTPIETLIQHVFHNSKNVKYDFIDLDTRSLPAKISTLAGIIKSCKAFVCGVSGNFHLALSLLPYDKVCLLEKDFLAPSFTKHPIARVDIKNYTDGAIKHWLLNNKLPEIAKKDVFVLEDMPDRQAAFKKKFLNCNLVMVNNVKEALEILKNKQFDLVCLDHDLSYDPATGNGVFLSLNDPGAGGRVAEFLAQTNYKGTVIIQSLNSGGAEYMNKLLPNAKRIPFYWDKKED